jgi:hypothetical protein
MVFRRSGLLVAHSDILNIVHSRDYPLPEQIKELDTKLAIPLWDFLSGVTVI